MAGHSHSPYLEDIPLEQALERWWQALDEAGLNGPFAGEMAPLSEAAGRITAEPVWARLSSPNYHASAMDGYAVRAADTAGATEARPVYLLVGEAAHYVDTGEPLPADTNAVVMVEEVQLRSVAGGQEIELLHAVPPWQHVRPMGEDMVATELVLPANHRLRPQDLGAAAGAGHGELSVRRRPRVAIQPTGTELVAPGQRGEAGRRRSSTIRWFSPPWSRSGAPCRDRLPPLPDDYAALRDRIAAAAAEHDLVLDQCRIVGGLGRLHRPHRRRAWTAARTRHRHPSRASGHPGAGACPARTARTGCVPVIGVPGYPVSAVVTCELLVRPTVSRLAWPATRASAPRCRQPLPARSSRPMGEEEFMRVTVGQVGERLVATPLSRRVGRDHVAGARRRDGANPARASRGSRRAAR